MEFRNCKNMLIIRPDNMGDLLMSSPAIRAIKKSFNCKITVLCSTKASEVAAMIEEIDEQIAFDLPWLKFDSTTTENVDHLIETLKQRSFDGCILFNVYSQNPAPCLMLAYLAGIPCRAAYSRENLYGLLTHWLPDDEPFSLIRHQVERDLNLARFLKADVADDTIKITEPVPQSAFALLERYDFTPKGYFVLHTGVSENKRQYPKAHWIVLAKLLIEQYQLPVVFTGSAAESSFAQRLVNEIGHGAINLAGKLNLQDLTAIIKQAKCMVSVNTGPMHLAVALKTPLVALYAQTNPQHTPYKSKHRLLEFSVPEELRSANQIIRAVNEKYYAQNIPYPTPQQVIEQLSGLVDEATAVAPLPEPDFHPDILSSR
ncbi:glycosyltransferase family 9 protein [Pedobacter endophyticus]|uniref:Glycosyltransferase family 9 protein n=1 Tax=Pedobacter endophyticus TaxID=2789740 RepID=A0A7S9L2K0_9SPHI|nr:glycosyltransferase family 9 protein [Pedobacter endophyticus]QPH41278.1 glycosyltransferase family 9 protein [Pedobacter endophyticus]